MNLNYLMVRLNLVIPMINSKTICNNHTSKNFDAPCLVSNLSGSLVVLMTQEPSFDTFTFQGTVIWSTVDMDFLIGHFSKCWNINEFKLFDGKLELSNFYD